MIFDELHKTNGKYKTKIRKKIIRKDPVVLLNCYVNQTIYGHERGIGTYRIERVYFMIVDGFYDRSSFYE